MILDHTYVVFFVSFSAQLERHVPKTTPSATGNMLLYYLNQWTGEDTRFFPSWIKITTGIKNIRISLQLSNLLFKIFTEWLFTIASDSNTWMKDYTWAAKLVYQNQCLQITAWEWMYDKKLIISWKFYRKGVVLHHSSRMWSHCNQHQSAQQWILRRWVVFHDKILNNFMLISWQNSL